MNIVLSMQETWFSGSAAMSEKNKGEVTKLRVEAKDSQSIYAALGSDEPAIQQHRIQELISIIKLFPQDSDQEKETKILSASLSLADIAPKGDLERMLAVQMIATHTASMECLRRAMIDGQTFEGRDVNLKHAEKLMAVYSKQLDTLNKHRGKGQQKITVQHVNVEPGGQAIVGHVETEKSLSDVAESPKILESPDEMPFSFPPLRQTVKDKSKL